MNEQFINELATALRKVGTIHTVGEEWVSYIGEIPNGGVPYCGQEVTRTTYSALWSYAQDKGLVKTEAEWQQIATTNGGNVPYYSNGNGSTTFRVPKLVGYIRGASSQSEAGEYVAEGLPNITGQTLTNYNDASKFNGAFVYTGSSFSGIGANSQTNTYINFDASRSNPIYGNSSHVTPETSVVLFGVYAFGVITNAGELDVSTLASDVDNIKTSYLPLKGGTVTGQLAVDGYVLAKSGYILKGDQDGALYVMSGNGWANSGSYLTLAPRDDANGANFQLTATDGTNTAQLKGTHKGTLTWKGNEVITSVGGTLNNTLSYTGNVFAKKTTNDSYIVIQGGSGWDYGAYLQLNGSEASGGASDFCLASRLNGKHIELRGKNDGTLQWDGKNLVRSVNGTSADANGNVAVGASPVGTVIAFAANSAPSGYLLCNGSAVSRTTYADLFATIGTTYGSGDGSTTFNLPNLTDKFIQGSGTAGTSKSAGLPNITASFKGNCLTQGNPTVSGAITVMDTGSSSTDARHYSMNSKQGFNFSASNSSSIYGASTTVQPPALTMRMYIKY